MNTETKKDNNTKEGRRDEVKCSLCVLNLDCPAETISKILETQPTETWLNGDLIDQRTLVKHKQNGWRLQSPADPFNTNPERAIDSLLNAFTNLNAFQNLPSGLKVEITCSIFSFTQRPAVYLSAQLISRVAQIGANLDFDIYDLTETTSS